MRRFFKLFFIALGTFFLLLLVSASILVWIVFTPARLTPLIRSQADKHIPYLTEIGEVELTLFSTFPQFGIRVNGLSVISPGTGSPSDTLARADAITGVIDAKAFWKDRRLTICNFILSNGSVNIFSDSLGHTNFGLLISEPAGPDNSPEREWDLASLNNAEINNLSFSYTDLAAGISSSISGLSAKMAGDFGDESFTGSLSLSNAIVSVKYGGHDYLDNAGIKISTPEGGIMLKRNRLLLKEVFASINDLGILLTGSVENGAEGNGVAADLDFRLSDWEIGEAMALVPPAYLAGYGIASASGEISSSGIIRGVINGSQRPFADIDLALARGALEYDGLPFRLNGVNGEFRFYFDPSGESVSYIHAGFFEARTPSSRFTGSGRLNNLFSAMHFDFSAGGDILADEFVSFIPDGIEIDISGRVRGQVRGGFAMPVPPGKVPGDMRISGTASLSGFRLANDSITIAAGSAGLDFSMPDTDPSGVNTGFASVKISADTLLASKTGDFRTFIKNGHFYIEMSDITDTILQPSFFFTFSNDSVWAERDTMSIAINKPLGWFSLTPAPGDEARQHLSGACHGYNLQARTGHSSVIVEDINIHADIINDDSREDIFLKWLATGVVEMKNGSVKLAGFPDPLSIPSVRMDFEPENFILQESKFIVGQSDFGLAGELSNVLSFFRGDSILRGDFSLESGKTDLAYLMAISSGLGAGTEGSGAKPPHDNADNPNGAKNSNSADNPNGAKNSYNADNPNGAKNSYSADNSGNGPYMVPLGVDIALRTDVRKAFFGADTASNILGRVHVNDGILLLDALTFTTPAADMQLTAMYRTPRKNHIYLGLDYHLMDVEISRLLKMLPDLDTLMPMLRSFEGSGEFHIAVETYLDSLYNVKKSTLRGASSIRGQDLVLMDGETFGEIARTLRFTRQAKNRVDSLSAEFTIFREEIDVYPFLMVMDRYKVVIGGRHNLDMSFDYHISLVESPLPIRMGVNIAGNMDRMQYQLTMPRYAEFYRPASRRAVESRQLEFRKMIREALLDNIREQE